MIKNDFLFKNCDVKKAMRDRQKAIEKELNMDNSSSQVDVDLANNKKNLKKLSECPIIKKYKNKD